MGFGQKKIAIFILLFFCFCIKFVAAASKFVEVDSLSVEAGFLTTSFHAEGMLDAQLAEQLRRGFTCVFEYEIQLWQDRAVRFDHVLAQKKIRVKITYDTWEQRFHIIAPTEHRRTTSIESVKEWCLSYRDIQLYSLDKLKPEEKYAVSVRLLLKPISVENLNEIERALGGHRDIAPDQKPRLDQKNHRGSRLIRFLISLVGLGDKIYGSPRFEFKILGDNQVLVTE
ncbi:DUF4390 domain-containing protein [bacterium]|nr:DUF4390 domain-containing protein [bacterium]